MHVIIKYIGTRHEEIKLCIYRESWFRSLLKTEQVVFQGIQSLKPLWPLGEYLYRDLGLKLLNLLMTQEVQAKWNSEKWIRKKNTCVLDLQTIIDHFNDDLETYLWRADNTLQFIFIGKRMPKCQTFWEVTMEMLHNTMALYQTRLSYVLQDNSH